MREVIFIKSLCQGIVLFLYKTVNFKTTTESLGKYSRKIPLWAKSRQNMAILGIKTWKMENIAKNDRKEGIRTYQGFGELI